MPTLLLQPSANMSSCITPAYLFLWNVVRTSDHPGGSRSQQYRETLPAAAKLNKVFKAPSQKSGTTQRPEAKSFTPKEGTANTHLTSEPMTDSRQPMVTASPCNNGPTGTSSTQQASRSKPSKKPIKLVKPPDQPFLLDMNLTRKSCSGNDNSRS